MVKSCASPFQYSLRTHLNTYLINKLLRLHSCALIFFFITHNNKMIERQVNQLFVICSIAIFRDFIYQWLNKLRNLFVINVYFELSITKINYRKPIARCKIPIKIVKSSADYIWKTSELPKLSYVILQIVFLRFVTGL